VVVTAPDNPVRLWASSDGVPYGGWKYYPNDGWWSREFAWDMAYVAEFNSSPYLYIDVTILNTTLSSGGQTLIAIVDDGIPGGNPNVASVNLLWSTDGMTSWDSTAMVNTTGDEYVADIPGQSPSTIIDYYVKATDINGNAFTSPIYQYRIFEPSGAPNLVVFNGYNTDSGYPQSYYFGIDDFASYNTFEFWHDVWAFGPLTMELLNYYTNVIEITSSGPENINSDTIATWLAAFGDRNYMLAGDEWLGAQSGWPDSLQHFPGEFIYDMLGIEWEYNDIVNTSADISRVMPIDGSLLGDSLFYLAGVNATDSMLYDPNGEINQSNWLDGVVFLGDVEVDIFGISSRDISAGRAFAIAGHRTLAAGNKVAFLAYDPLSLNADPYYWYGFSSTAPQVQVLHWFGADTLTSINKKEQILSQFFLSQNYPNPFNPETKIEYSISKASDVQLTVYDVLGREIANLENSYKKAGKYSVNFDGRNYASGLYYYKLTTSDKTKIRKMLLIK